MFKYGASYLSCTLLCKKRPLGEAGMKLLACADTSSMRTRDIKLEKPLPIHQWVGFFFFFFLPVLRLYATPWVMTDFRRPYNTWFDLALCPLFHPFLLYLAATVECDFWALPS